MATAVNRQTGATVSADEAVLRRLPHPWQVKESSPTKKATSKRRRATAAESAEDH